MIVLGYAFPSSPKTTQLLHPGLPSREKVIHPNAKGRPGSGRVIARRHCILEEFKGSLTL